jgi:1-pyrroline-5-carboxylate dehydrogenase
LFVEITGKVRLEDAGFDWKVLGPDVSPSNFESVAWQCDQDAYAASGQKCSAQSILFAHKNWVEKGIFAQLRKLASRRTLDDLTVGPVLSHTTEEILAHCERLLSIPGTRLEFGGKELLDGKHSIPSCYGALEPTAVFVPLDALLDDAHFDDCVKEIFGPFQVLTEYKGGSEAEEVKVLEVMERMSHHLTAAVVSNDPQFVGRMLANTVNGTTYAGIRARTTAAPQNHWFGPAGDPRGAGIGTPEAIRLVWSCHREIIYDEGPISWHEQGPWTDPGPS